MGAGPAVIDLLGISWLLGVALAVARVTGLHRSVRLPRFGMSVGVWNCDPAYRKRDPAADDCDEANRASESWGGPIHPVGTDLDAFDHRG